MSHFLILYYVIVALIGCIALPISILGTIRSQIKSYWMLILFYGAFTAMVGVLFIRQYVYINIENYSLDTAALSRVTSSYLTILFMTAITLYFHRLFDTGIRRIRDWTVVALYVLTAVLFSWPGAATIDAERKMLILGSGIQFANAVHLALFGYLIILCFFGTKRDRPLRELILIWALCIFAGVGFAENCISFVKRFSNPELLLGAAEGDFLISTIPYLAFGVILVYYFGTYLLAERKVPGSISRQFVEKYGISPREGELIPFLNQGFSNREIAEKMCISIATVKTHIHNIYEKTGANSRYQLFNLLMEPE